MPFTRKRGVKYQTIDGDSLRQWKMVTSESTKSRPRNRLPKIYPVDYDRETNRYAKFHANPSIGGFSTNW